MSHTVLKSCVPQIPSTRRHPPFFPLSFRLHLPFRKHFRQRLSARDIHCLRIDPTISCHAMMCYVFCYIAIFHIISWCDINFWFQYLISSPLFVWDSISRILVAPPQTNGWTSSKSRRLASTSVVHGYKLNIRPYCNMTASAVSSVLFFAEFSYCYPPWWNVFCIWP